jgi:protein TonB
MIFSNEWCKIVFEGRNHLYGAYQLRQKSSDRHFWALLIAIILFVLACLSPEILRHILPQQKEKNVSVRTFSEIKIDKPKENILKEIPPPPPVRNTIKFTPPVIKPDELVDELDEPKMQKEMVEQKAAIGAVDFNKGTDDVAAPKAVVENAKITEDNDKVFVFVEQMPEFPGGLKEMMKFLVQNIKYPALAQEIGVEGIVFLNFDVDRIGNIANIKIIRSVGSGCDEEAIRVVKIMPRWNPGKQAGKAVKVNFTLPIKFLLRKSH